MCRLIVIAVASLGVAFTGGGARAASGEAPHPPKAAAPAPPAARRPGPVDYKTEVAPLFARYCISCHGADKKKADLRLDVYSAGDGARILKDLGVWQTVAERLEAHDMPPEEKPQPSEAENDLLLAWLDQTVSRALAQARRDPGRVTIRRLNRAEYNNTVRDLFGVDLKPAQEFPSDDVGYGFDNIGDVLTMPPVLVERYLTAAERIVERVIVSDIAPRSRTRTIEAERLAPTPAGSHVKGGALVMTANATLRTRHEFPVDAEYAFKIKAWGNGGKGLAGKEPVRLVLRIDGTEVKSAAVTAGRGATATISVVAAVEAGDKTVELSYANANPDPIVAADAKAPPIPDRFVAVDSLRIEGPLRATDIKLPASHLRIIPRHPGKDSAASAAREFLATLASRAYRRPARPEEVERLARFVDAALADGDSFERGMQLAVRAMLVSPHFLYRVELDQGAGGDGAASEPRAIGDFELASRLSYFLWTSMPDDQLYRLAKEGTLHTPEVLEAEARRMLEDPRSKALVDNFAAQWLQIRNLPTVRVNRKQFPGFNDELKAAMARETELFFESVMREDRSLVTFLDADYTFLNERLARHYGLTDIMGDEFRRVSLPDNSRGGVLTQASVLTVTSNPTRTSPVKRGRWVLEQLLGTPPPPPPPGVPELPEQGERRKLTASTLRQLMEQHRKDPNCAVCHKKMDPLGFGLENFDAVGSWREREGEQAIDSSGVLPNGQKFAGPGELKRVLLAKVPQFRRSLAGKMLTYALGRGTEPYDRPAIDEISARVERADNKFSSLVLAIVQSEPFQKRRGQQEEARP